MANVFTNLARIAPLAFLLSILTLAVTAQVDRPNEAASSGLVDVVGTEARVRATPEATTTTQPSTTAPEATTTTQPSTTAPEATTTTQPSTTATEDLVSLGNVLIDQRVLDSLPQRSVADLRAAVDTPWRIVVEEGVAFRGLFDHEEQKITIRDSNDTFVALHEIAHLLDFLRVSGSEAARWMDRRGMTVWYSQSTNVNDLAFGAGDFADTYAECSGNQSLGRVTLPTADDCALIYQMIE